MNPRQTADATRVILHNRGFLKLLVGVHVLLYRLTAGVVGGMSAGCPTLLLTTKGRRSGRLFTTPLCFLTEGTSFVVVASYGGSDVEPSWWQNLKASGEGWIEVGSTRLPVTAEQASSELKARLWPAFVRLYPTYEEYQRRTSRVIPLVLLTPR